MSLINNHLGVFGGDMIARDRERAATPTYQIRRPGKRYCESCRGFKPATGVARKGWRCGDCKKAKKSAENS